MNEVERIARETFGSEIVVIHKQSYEEEFVEKLWECFWMLVTRICAGIGVGLGFVGTLWIVKYITDWGV